MKLEQRAEEDELVKHAWDNGYQAGFRAALTAVMEGAKDWSEPMVDPEGFDDESIKIKDLTRITEELGE